MAVHPTPSSFPDPPSSTGEAMSATSATLPRYSRSTSLRYEAPPQNGQTTQTVAALANVERAAAPGTGGDAVRHGVRSPRAIRRTTTSEAPTSSARRAAHPQSGRSRQQ